MNRVAKVAVAAVIVVVVYVGVMRLVVDHTGKPEVRVTLSGATCTPAITEVIGGGWLQKVTWKVTNNCANAQIVTMQNFVNDDGGRKGSEQRTVFFDQPINSGRINNGAADHPVNARVSRLVVSTTMFHYTICTSDQTTQVTQCLDPDVEIWP